MLRCNAEISTSFKKAFTQRLHLQHRILRLTLSALHLAVFLYCPSITFADSDVDIVGKTDIISTTKKVTGAATGNTIQAARTGQDFHIVVVGLPANETVQLEMGFAELEAKTAGQRVFNVAVNDKPALTNFDVVKAAEGPFRSVVKKFSITPDRGFLDFHFTGVQGDALINYINISAGQLQKSITTPAPTIVGQLMSDPEDYAIPADQQASFEVESGSITVDSAVETWSSGVPIGGIGTGKFEILPNGQFANFTINNSWDLPVLRPRGTFLAIAAKASSRGGSARLLYANPSDPTDKAHFEDYSNVSTASFSGQFPYGSVTLKDDKIPLITTVEGWSPLIPHNVEDSALPVGVINVTVENPEKYPIATAVAFSWEDLNGRGGSLLPGDQHGFSGRATHQDAATSNVTGFQISTEQIEQDRSATFAGNYFVGTPIKGASITRKLSWNPRRGTIPWWKQFSSRLRLDTIPSTPAAIRTDANSGPMASTICVSFNLAPKEVRRIPFIVSWYFPQIVTLDSVAGNPSVEVPDYVERFGSSAGVASYLASKRHDLREATDDWHDMITRSTLPQWVKSHSLNSLFPIRSNSVLLKNDRFAMLEAPADMKGMLGPVDLRMASGDFLRSMFPQLEKTELNLYARAQDETGRIPRYVGNIHGALAGFDPNLLGTEWVDPTATWLLQVAAYWRETADSTFIDSLKPQITKARDFLQLQLKDGKVASSTNAFSATDPYVSAGNMNVLNCLGALRAASDLLKEPAAEIEATIKGALAEQNLPTDGPAFAALTATEYGLRQAGLGGLHTKDAVSAYLQRIYTSNFQVSKPVPLMESTGGDTLPTGDFGFPSPLQTYVGAVALAAGLPDIGLEPYLRMFQVAYAAQKAPWKQALRYDVPAGARASIRYHRVAMAGWSIWRSISGAVHDMPAQRLHLKPVSITGTQEDMEVPVFTPKFWGWLKYNNQDSTGTLAVTHVFSETSLTLTSIATGVDNNGNPENLVTFPEPFVLEQDATLEFSGWPGKPGGTVYAQKPALPEPEDPGTTDTLSLDDQLTSPSADDTISTTTRDSEDGEEMPADSQDAETDSDEEPDGDDVDASSASEERESAADSLPAVTTDSDEE